MGRRKKNSKSNDQTKKSDVKTIPTHPPCSSSPENSENSTKNVHPSKLLNVHARLSLPFLRLNENNSSTDSDDEETLEFDFKPRLVHCCNMCIVCMNVSAKPLNCENCRMLSYCSTKHRDEHFLQHLPLCKVLTVDCRGIEGFLFAQDLTPDKYRVYRVTMINLIERRMQRRLELWEREIILYPRVCRTCQKIGEQLKCCDVCMIDFYCDDHRDDHLKWCKDFQVFRTILTMQRKHGHVDPNFPDTWQKFCRELPENFDEFLFNMFRNDANYRRIDCYTYATMSLSATIPLTAMFAMQKTFQDWQTKERLNVHIVGAEFEFECSNLRVWEKLFVHYLPNLRKLCLEFSGPELSLPKAPLELLAKVQMCRRCKSEERCVRVNFHPGKLYHEVLSENKADLICLFNPGLYRETGYDGGDTWPLTIERFCDAGVPVVVTSYTEVEIPKDIARIQKLRNIEILMEPQKNPFAAVKPDRNFVSDDIMPLMYKNYCLSVVRGV